VVICSGDQSIYLGKEIEQENGDEKMSPITFSPEDKKRINNALKTIDDAKKEIERAKRAGIDLSDLEKRILENEQKLRAIKQVYFPNE